MAWREHTVWGHPMQWCEGHEDGTGYLEYTNFAIRTPNFVLHLMTFIQFRMIFK